MIEPGDRFTIEQGGRVFDCACLTRSQQRKAIGVLSRLQSLEESIESIQEVYTAADELLDICCPDMLDSDRDRLSNSDIFEIAGKVIAKHAMGIEERKKSELPRSSERGNYAKVAVPDVIATSWEH